MIEFLLTGDNTSMDAWINHHFQQPDKVLGHLLHFDRNRKGQKWTHQMYILRSWPMFLSYNRILCISLFPVQTQCDEEDQDTG